jgi:hypothetical protein
MNQKSSLREKPQSVPRVLTPDMFESVPVGSHSLSDTSNSTSHFRNNIRKLNAALVMLACAELTIGDVGFPTIL